MPLRQSAQELIGRGLSHGMKRAFVAPIGATEAMLAVLKQLDGPTSKQDAVDLLRDADKSRRS